MGSATGNVTNTTSLTAPSATKSQVLSSAMFVDLEQVVQGELLVLGVAPELLAHLEVDELREGLGQAVRHRVEQDRLVHLAGRKIHGKHCNTRTRIPASRRKESG